MNDNTGLPTAFIRTVVEQLHASRWLTALTLSTSVALFPIASLTNAGVARYCVSLVGLASTVAATKARRKQEELAEVAADMSLVERKQTIAWYNRQLGSTSTVTFAPQPTSDAHIRTNLVHYWLQQDKHLLIVGGTGDGKSTFIQAFASQLGASWAFQVYDNDCTIDDWTNIRSNPKTRMFESYAAIAQQMAFDMDTIESRTQERKVAGNTWNTQPTLTVAEEMPALVSEIEDSGKWLATHAKRGRRVKRFIAVVSQNDTVDNLGLRGDSALRDSCFVRVYLGKSAIARAKQLKQPALVQSLEAGGYNVCLVDDVLYDRPQPSYSSHMNSQQGISEDRYFYSGENPPKYRSTEAIEAEVVESGSGTGFSSASASAASSASPASTASVQQISGYFSTRSEATRMQEIELLLNTKLTDDGWRLMQKWLPKNRVNATTPAKLAYAMRHLQLRGLALTNRKMAELVWGITGGTSYSDVCRLIDAIASTGVHQIQ